MNKWKDPYILNVRNRLGSQPVNFKAFLFSLRAEQQNSDMALWLNYGLDKC